MEGKETFGAFIANRRKELNMTQKEMAEKLFISESAVSKWERGITYPDITLVKDICDALNISESELFASGLDFEKRKKEKLAYKYLRLIKVYKMFFYVAYGIALLSCFICNIAINHKLSWFFIVLTAIMTAASLTLVPILVEKNKLLYTVLSFTVSLILLLFTCCIFTNGHWFVIAVIPYIFSITLLFLPMMLKKLNLPSFLYNNKALVCFAVDTILLFVMLIVLGVEVGGKGYFSIAIPITLISLIYAWALLFFIRYLKFNGFIKAGISLIFSGIFYPVFNKVSQIIIPNSIKTSIFNANLLDWTYDNINENIMVIIFLLCLVLGVIFMAAGIKKCKDR